MKTVLDIETNTLNKGNPFSRGGKLVCVGFKPITQKQQIFWENFDTLECPNYLIGMNIKFDLHWCRRAGIKLPDDLRVWDVQLAHFMLTGQATPYPSLNDIATYYGLPLKLDVVKDEYWDKGIDTDQIPREVLTTYLNQDLLLTQQVYEKQIEDFKRADPNLHRLFMLHCRDLLVLADMEYNGMVYSTQESLEILEKEEKDIHEIEEHLTQYFPDIPINWDSRDNLSCCLYGGTIIHESRVPVGVYKTGIKSGEPRYKIIEVKYEIPQMVRPLKGSELAKPGYWATDEPTLKSLSGNAKAKRFIALLLERSTKAKLCNTYYRGIPELITTMDWDDGIIHGQFNQCVAATGRLSSSRPNLQNFAGEVDYLLRSHYV